MHYWLPLAIAAGLLTLLAGLAIQRERLAAKRKQNPRPAPDYAARLRGSPPPAVLPESTPTSTPSESSAPAEPVSAASGALPDWDDGPQTILQRPNASPEESIPEFDLDIDDPGLPTKLQVAPGKWVETNAEGQPVQTHPIQDSPIEDNPIEDNLAQDNPVQDNSVENTLAQEMAEDDDAGPQTLLQASPVAADPAANSPPSIETIEDLEDSGPQTILQVNSTSEGPSMINPADEGAIANLPNADPFFDSESPVADASSSHPPTQTPTPDSWDPWDSP